MTAGNHISLTPGYDAKKERKLYVFIDILFKGDKTSEVFCQIP